MPSRFKTYGADEVVVTFAGVLIQGYADGEFVRIEWDSDAFSDVAGTDGEVARGKTSDNRATVTVLLMQTADANDLLSAIHALDKRAKNGAGVGMLQIEDLSGRSLYRGTHAWIARSPAASFDRDLTSREWKFRVAELEDFTGGN